MLETHFISSPEIESIGYDAEHKELHVRMRNGKERIFYNVEKQTYSELMQSGSKMEFLKKMNPSV
ncbi:KTSC domain-containing protein [Leptospira stimsonii]|uniref:KTSC domain-containing protein n=1 Tax=Leptospira stimsonii TaxID=2202203 RepID=A0A8B3CU71_9LEPT|nr:KTSC domain-containing protein [Leptospira stimsonii]RHX88235.1 KTSC domain-containing protein [Leptospira stimsonii]